MPCCGNYGRYCGPPYGYMRGGMRSRGYDFDGLEGRRFRDFDRDDFRRRPFVDFDRDDFRRRPSGLDRDGFMRRGY